jgi:oligoendopeptidase F
MYTQKSWDLGVVRSDVKTTLGEIEKLVKKFERKKNQLTTTISSKTFMNLVYGLEHIRKVTSKLGVYVHLQFCENATNQKSVALMSHVEQALTKLGNRMIFFSLWFKQLPDKKARQLIAAAGPYAYHFRLLRKHKKHTLSEKEEKIINIKDASGGSALMNIYEMFTSSFEFQFKGKMVTQEELVTYVKSPNAITRKEAYVTLLTPFKKHKNVIGEIYKNIINDWREEHVGLRGYTSPISVRNTANDLPDKAVDVLLKVCDKNQKIFHTFFEIKRKKLKLTKLRRFDLYAPLKEERGHIPYDEAVRRILETFASFSPKFHDAAHTIIGQSHIHSTVQKGKRSGAFCCPATTDHPPYVLLSYTGKYRDMSTLAHELGHGIHFTLSQVQTEFTHDACLPLAETASIFSEMLLSEQLMKEKPEVAKEMMFRKLDDLYASIIRQAGFVSFERKAHQMMKEGKTIDEMSAVYLEDLRKQLGSKVDVDDIYAYEWCYIPHIFHTPFYCYAYAFGNLLTLALYEMYTEQGQPFVLKIEKFLSMGGSMEPVKIARIVGADITSKKFWQKGFDVIEEMIEKVR